MKPRGQSGGWREGKGSRGQGKGKEERGRERRERRGKEEWRTHIDSNKIRTYLIIYTVIVILKYIHVLYMHALVGAQVSPIGPPCSLSSMITPSLLVGVASLSSGGGVVTVESLVMEE